MAKKKSGLTDLAKREERLAYWLLVPTLLIIVVIAFFAVDSIVEQGIERGAAYALGVTTEEIVREVDSVTFCLSKGLCAPVGSMVCGSTDFIAKARRARKVVGGGMRQAGVIAAAGIIALEQMIDRLADDHLRAHHLAEGLAQIPGIDVAPVTTNILYFETTDEVKKSPEEIEAALRDRGVLVNSRGGGRFRAVTHYGVDDADIQRAIRAVRHAVA